MERDELIAALKDAFGFELKEGSEAVIFVDAAALDARTLEWLPEMAVTFVMVLPPTGQTVADCVSAVTVKEKKNAGGE